MTIKITDNNKINLNVGTNKPGAQGPQGPAGATGPQGPAGLKGDTGAIGPQGPTGTQGIKGDAGADGAQGVQGPVGSQGIKGDTGNTGPTGSIGLTGPQGIAGTAGAQGPSGSVGATGPQGPTGLTGAAGASFDIDSYAVTSSIDNNDLLFLSRNSSGNEFKITLTDLNTKIETLISPALQSYTDTAIANLINGAPGTLDTLEELATALNDNSNFATNLTNVVNTKLASADFNALWDTRFSTKTTNNIPEGSTNLYYTSSRADADIDAKITQPYINALNINADKLDGYHASSFIQTGTLAAVASTGAYGDLNGVPVYHTVAQTGDYNDLINVPLGITYYRNLDVDDHLNLSTAATNQVLSWNGTDYDWVNQSAGGGGGTSNFSGSYNDLTNKPVLFDGDYNTLTNQPTLFDGNYNTLTNKPTLFDGDYNSLINKPSTQVLTAGTNVTITGNVIDVGSIALTSVRTAVSEAIQLGFSLQEGDVVVRTDLNESYMHNGGTAGTMADFTLLATPTNAVLSVVGQTGSISAAQIKTAYEAEANTNAFTDTEKTKLSNIEINADVTDTTNVVAALTAGSNITIAADGTIASTASGTSITIQDEGVDLATAASTINFVGSGVTASGTGSTKTITISSGGGSSVSSGAIVGTDLVLTNADATTVTIDATDLINPTPFINQTGQHWYVAYGTNADVEVTDPQTSNYTVGNAPLYYGEKLQKGFEFVWTQFHMTAQTTFHYSIGIYDGDPTQAGQSSATDLSNWSTKFSFCIDELMADFSNVDNAERSSKNTDIAASTTFTSGTVFRLRYCADNKLRLYADDALVASTIVAESGNDLDIFFANRGANLEIPDVVNRSFNLDRLSETDDKWYVAYGPKSDQEITTPITDLAMYSHNPMYWGEALEPGKEFRWTQYYLTNNQQYYMSIGVWSGDTTQAAGVLSTAMTNWSTKFGFYFKYLMEDTSTHANGGYSSKNTDIAGSTQFADGSIMRLVYSATDYKLRLYANNTLMATTLVPESGDPLKIHFMADHLGNEYPSFTTKTTNALESTGSNWYRSYGINADEEVIPTSITSTVWDEAPYYWGEPLTRGNDFSFNMSTGQQWRMGIWGNNTSPQTYNTGAIDYSNWDTVFSFLNGNTEFVGASNTEVQDYNNGSNYTVASNAPLVLRFLHNGHLELIDTTGGAEMTIGKTITPLTVDSFKVQFSGWANAVFPVPTISNANTIWEIAHDENLAEDGIINGVKSHTVIKSVMSIVPGEQININFNQSAQGDWYGTNYLGASSGVGTAEGQIHNKFRYQTNESFIGTDYQFNTSSTNYFEAGGGTIPGWRQGGAGTIQGVVSLRYYDDYSIQLWSEVVGERIATAFNAGDGSPIHLFNGFASPKTYNKIPAITKQTIAGGGSTGNNSGTGGMVVDLGAKTTNFSIATSSDFEAYLVDTTNNTIEVTLPGTPNNGQRIKIIDIGNNLSTNNLTINRNNNTIQGDASNLTVAINRSAFELMFVSTYGWVLMNK